MEICGEHHVMYCVQKTKVVSVNSYYPTVKLSLPPYLHIVHCMLHSTQVVITHIAFVIVNSPCM